jgi:phosphoglycerate dehydrogenase-like enzyme
MFDAGMLDAMKPGSFLYNIGRGAIVDQDELYARLASGRLGGAGLDVTSPEPLPADHPLWKLGNVIITPHVSGGSPKLWERGVDLWIENIRRFTHGEQLLNLVDLDAGY